MAYAIDLPIITNHAQKRCQQRAIKRQHLLLIQDYGTCYYAGDGALAFHVDKRAITAAKRDGLKLSPLQNVAAIFHDDVTISTMHAKRTPKHWRRASWGV